MTVTARMLNTSPTDLDDVDKQQLLASIDAFVECDLGAAGASYGRWWITKYETMTPCSSTSCCRPNNSHSRPALAGAGAAVGKILRASAGQVTD